MLFKMPAYIYLFLWALMAFFPYIYFSTKMYTALLCVFSVTSVVCSLYAILNYKLPVFVKFLFVFVFILAIYGGYAAILGDDLYWQSSAVVVKKYDYILWLLTSLLSPVPIYVFTCKGMIQEKEMKLFFFVMLISCIYAFYVFSQEKMLEVAMLDLEEDEFTVTCVYSFLSILPCIMLFRNKLFLQFIIICVVLTFCILGVKRGPVLLCILCTLFFVWNTLGQVSAKKKIIILFVFLGIAYGVYEFILYQIETSRYFALRVEQTLDGDTSDRDVYGMNILDYFAHSTSTMEFLIGIGANRTLVANNSFAHNDWLGILLEQGIVGFLLYLLYWCGFITSWLKSKCTNESFMALGMLLIIGLGKSLFSMYYLPVTAEMIISSGFFAVGLGYFLAKAYPQEIRDAGSLDENC